MNDFLIELKALLEKYNASIDVDYHDCSDTHGMQGEAMRVSVGKESKEICWGWGIEANDIKLEVNK
jgi:hypothetical protein